MSTYCGSIPVGTQFSTTLSTMYSHTMNAFAELVDNAISANAKVCKVDLCSAAQLGAAVSGNLPVLSVKTDTFIDVNQAFQIAHSNVDGHGELNHFGLGFKGFLARLLGSAELLVVTRRRHEDNKLHYSFARMGEAVDTMVTRHGNHIGVCIAHGVVDELRGDVKIDWGTNYKAQLHYFDDLPWKHHNEVEHKTLRRLLVPLTDMDEHDSATAFLFYDRTHGLPLHVDQTTKELMIGDHDGDERVLSEELRIMYLTLPSPMPHITVTLHEVSIPASPFEQVLAEYKSSYIQTTSMAYPLYVPGVFEPIATVTYLRVAPGADAYQMHNAGMGGATFSLANKVINPGDLQSVYDGGTVFGLKNNLNFFISIASRKGISREQLRHLVEYVACGVTWAVDEARARVPPNTYLGISGKIGSNGLWSRIGLGLMSWVQWNPKVVSPNTSKTGLSFIGVPFSGAELLAAVRVHRLAYSMVQADDNFVPPFAVPSGESRARVNLVRRPPRKSYVAEQIDMQVEQELDDEMSDDMSSKSKRLSKVSSKMSSDTRLVVWTGATATQTPTDPEQVAAASAAGTHKPKKSIKRPRYKERCAIMEEALCSVRELTHSSKTISSIVNKALQRATKV